MICFCAERFHWRRIWQNPGELLLPGLSEMATRALLYRRPAEPATSCRQTWLPTISRSACAGIAARARYTLRIHPTDREAILTDAAARHDRGSKGLRAASRRLDRRASWPLAEGCTVPARHNRAAARRAASARAPCRASAARCGARPRDSGERILCVAGGLEHMDRRVHDFLKREARKESAQGVA